MALPKTIDKKIAFVKRKNTRKPNDLTIFRADAVLGDFRSYSGFLLNFLSSYFLPFLVNNFLFPVQTLPAVEAVEACKSPQIQKFNRVSSFLREVA